MLFRKMVLLASLSLLCACEPPPLPTPFHAKDVTAQFQVQDFQLSDQQGKLRKLSDFRGKVVLVFFGYTHCPQICPTTLADLSDVMNKLGADAAKVQVLFVTVDPERDTAASLNEYMQQFNPTFLALRGNAEETAHAAKVFNVSYQRQESDESYYFDHTTGTFIVDGKGKVRLHTPHAQRSDWMIEDIRLLLKGV